MAQMQTFTGKIVDLHSPTRDAVDIEDIAHALSMTCRYGGHCREFYSVAEHSVLLASYAANRQGFRGRPDALLSLLLHDAGEAYVGDMVTPLKRTMVEFSALEKAWHLVVLKRFGLELYGSDKHEAARRDLEREIVSYEVLSLFHPVASLWADLPYPDSIACPAGATIDCWSPAEARRQFLDRFHCLQQLRGSSIGWPKMVLEKG